MDQDHEDVEAEEREMNEAPPSSSNGHDPLADLRRLRREIEEDTSHKLDIPGYAGKLVAEYRKLSYPEVEKINRRVARMREKNHPNTQLLGDCDVLVEALVEIYLRKDPDKPDELEPLTRGFPSVTGEEGHTTWLDAAAVVLPDDKQLPPNAEQRSGVRAVFGADLAIPPHRIELAFWMQSLNEESDEDFGFAWSETSG